MTSPSLQREEEPERRKFDTTVGGGTAVEALVGLGAGILAVLGLAGILPFYMLSIGIIAAGVALFLEGVSVRTAYAKLSESYGVRTRVTDGAEVAGGFGAQSLCGGAAIVLGILALVGVLPGVLLAVGIMALGAGMLLGGPARAELEWSEVELHHSTDRSRRIASQAVHGSVGMLALFGIGAFILGILALALQTGSPSLAGTLLLVGLLAVGATELLSGSAMLGSAAIAAKH